MVTGFYDFAAQDLPARGGAAPRIRGHKDRLEITGSRVPTSKPKACSHAHPRSTTQASAAKAGELPASLASPGEDATTVLDAIEKAFDDVSRALAHAAVATPGRSIAAQ